MLAETPLTGHPVRETTRTLRDRVISPGIKGIAAHDALDPQPASFENAITVDGFICVL
jgi:hypothetical protein